MNVARHTSQTLERRFLRSKIGSEASNAKYMPETNAMANGIWRTSFPRNTRSTTNESPLRVKVPKTKYPWCVWTSAFRKPLFAISVK